MSLRIEWDKFEIALLIDACEQVQQNKISKSEMVSKLSSDLRKRAVRSGIDVDDVFRNNNGIFLQMTKMDYLLTNGKIGLPGAGKLFIEIADQRNNSPDKYAKLIREAKRQIKEAESKVVLENKTKFKQRLSTNRSKESTVVTSSSFYNYLRYNRDMSGATCLGYVSAISSAEIYAISKGFTQYKIYDCGASDAVQVIHSLLGNEDFMKFNEEQHNRFSAAFAKFIEFAGQLKAFWTSHRVKQIAVAKSEPTDYDKYKFEQTLLRRYRNGMQFDSIDFENFRETYEALFDERLSFDDIELQERLRHCGVYYNGRIFPSEGIMDENTKEKMFAYIDSSFSSGKKVLYYKAIFEDLAYAFSNCFVLCDENILRAYIEFMSEKNKYYFYPDYMSVEKDVLIDNTAEVEEYLLSAGKPIPVVDVCKAISHIPNDEVEKIITQNSRFLRNAKGEYFHINIFEASEAELEQIVEIINAYIKQNEYAIWTDVWGEIQIKMPLFVENNIYLSGLGIRNVLAQHLKGRFNFKGAVISMPIDQYAMKDIYQLYAKHHSKFTSKDIDYLSKELDTTIYFDALAEVSVRVSRDMFISKDTISFDVDAIDKVIGSFFSKDYIPIREIDSYLAFPNVGYEWNEYLLESFVYSYSKKYSLLSNGFSLNNVAGVVVKKSGLIHELVDACAKVLAESSIPLEKKEALNYLAKLNIITRRTYKEIDLAIRKAKQIRLRKG